MALLRSQFPCIPIPIIPNRRRSLAATDEARTGSGSSRMVLAARDAPTEAALMPRNVRRERIFLLNVILQPVTIFQVITQTPRRSGLNVSLFALPLPRSSNRTHYQRRKSKH